MTENRVKKWILISINQVVIELWIRIAVLLVG